MPNEKLIKLIEHFYDKTTGESPDLARLIEAEFEIVEKNPPEKIYKLNWANSLFSPKDLHGKEGKLYYSEDANHYILAFSTGSVIYVLCDGEVKE